MKSLEFSVLNTKVDEAITAMVKAYAIAHEKWTEQQMASAIKQAIACGDFTEYVVADTGDSTIVYIPFAREQELMHKIIDQNKVIEDLEHDICVLRQMLGERTLPDFMRTIS